MVFLKAFTPSERRASCYLGAVTAPRTAVTPVQPRLSVVAGGFGFVLGAYFLGFYYLAGLALGLLCTFILRGSSRSSGVAFVSSVRIRVAGFFIQGAARATHLVQDWVLTTNHRRIAVLYFSFIALAGFTGLVLATIIRLELAYPGQF